MNMRPFQIQLLSGNVRLRDPAIIKIRFVIAEDLAAAEVLALEAIGNASVCTGYRILDLDGRPLALAPIDKFSDR